MNKIKTIAWEVVGLAYSPIYVTGIALHFTARILLGISCGMMLERGRARDIFKSLVPHADK